MKAHRATALVVEDVAPQAEVCAGYLRAANFEVRIADTAQKAIDEAATWKPDVAIIDVELPDMNGLDLLRQVKASDPDLVVVIATANGSLTSAVEAVRDGAYDFIVKPYPAVRLTLTVKNALEKRRLLKKVDQYKQKFDRDSFFGIIGASPEMQVIYRTIESVGPSRAPVFIVGESGTGKELVAEAIHSVSGRRSKPFIALNCGAIPRDLVESEVFGHVKGAFTGATADRVGGARLADSGTLFLDEICELPFDMQVKLLRFIQTGTYQRVGSSAIERVDVRFVCATNRNPQAEIDAGTFREDLFYRLYVVPIHMPPLRERGDDVLLIAAAFLERANAEEKKSFEGFSLEAENVLRQYDWPGNVRQLQNVVRNVVILNEGLTIERSTLPEPLRSFAGPAVRQAVMTIQPFVEPTEAVTVPTKISPSPTGDREIRPLWEIEKEAILRALAETDDDVPKAAALLEINASTIYRRLQAWRAQEEH